MRALHTPFLPRACRAARYYRALYARCRAAFCVCAFACIWLWRALLAPTRARAARALSYLPACALCYLPACRVHSYRCDARAAAPRHSRAPPCRLRLAFPFFFYLHCTHYHTGSLFLCTAAPLRCCIARIQQHVTLYIPATVHLLTLITYPLIAYP